MNADTLLTKLNDLLNQATHERSHYYVAGTIKDCVAYILDHLSTEAEVRERERAAAANAWFECWRCHGYYSGQTDDEMRAEGKRWAEDWYTRRYGGEA